MVTYLLYSLALSQRQPLHPPINAVDVSRVTILPVSMTTTCCSPLIRLPLPPTLPFPFSSLSVVSLLSAHCWYFKVKEGHSQMERWRQRYGWRCGKTGDNSGRKGKQRRTRGQKCPRQCYCSRHRPQTHIQPKCCSRSVTLYHNYFIASLSQNGCQQAESCQTLGAFPQFYV